MAPINVFGADVKIHGEIVSWDAPAGLRVSYGVILSALDAAGLDKAAAREMAPRDAFARAARTMVERRIIRRVDDTAAALTFQFTAEARDGDRLRYDFEAILTLDKATGRVTCADDPALAVRAQAAVDAQTAVRTGSDLTKLIQKLFGRHADLFAVRRQGGCYFCPAAFADFLGKVEKFMAAVGAELRRFPVPAGVPSGDRSVREAVEDGLVGILRDHVRAVSEFDVSTRDSTIAKMAERIQTTRMKAEAYAEYLTDKADEVARVVAAARAALRRKAAQLGRAVDVPGDAVADSAALAGAAGARLAPEIAVPAQPVAAAPESSETPESPESPETPEVVAADSVPVADLYPVEAAAARGRYEIEAAFAAAGFAD